MQKMRGRATTTNSSNSDTLSDTSLFSLSPPSRFLSLPLGYIKYCIWAW